MRFRASEIATIVSGDIEGPDCEVLGARHDSREIRGGELFVPVRGDRDGHGFIEAALDEGAAAYLTANRPVGGTAIVVPEPEVALSELGEAARDRLPQRVIGITGSVGKTSTKDLCAAALATRFKTAASERSFNNELGVPLTLVNAPDGTQATVVEMGARGKGHIDDLCAIARPTIAVITTVEFVHTELFGAIDQVAEAKRELVEALPPHGTAVLNRANPHVLSMAAHTDAEVLTFGDSGADVRASRVEFDRELRPSFVLHSPWGEVDVHLGVHGEHNVLNALAAAGAALVAGVPIEGVASGLASAVLSPWRMQLQRCSSGAVVLNDAYNAGPASMEAALRSLARLEADRRIAVLGVMAELGGHSGEAHQVVAGIAAELGVQVIAVDAPWYEGSHVRHVGDHTEALALLDSEGVPAPGDAVLVKGSRVAGLERVALRLGNQ